jgi:hypothetical protein
MSAQFVLYNGWISISTSSDEQSFDELTKVVSELNAYIDSLTLKYHLCEIRTFNLERILLIGGSHNHDVGYNDQIVRLLNKVAELAPASHGVVYIRWPDDIFIGNEYKIYKMVRGKITFESDPFFSPCRPVIED